MSHAASTVSVLIKDTVSNTTYIVLGFSVTLVGVCAKKLYLFFDFLLNQKYAAFSVNNVILNEVYSSNNLASSRAHTGSFCHIYDWKLISQADRQELT